MYVQEELVDSQSYRVLRLDRPRKPALHGTVLLWRIWGREFASGSEAVTVINEHRIGVLGAVVGPEGSRDSHVGHETFHHTDNGGCALVPGPVRVLKA